MHFYIKKDKNGTQMQKKYILQFVYEEGTVNNRTCQTWFAKFYTVNFLLKHVFWSGRSVEIKSNYIKGVCVISRHDDFIC